MMQVQEVNEHLRNAATVHLQCSFEIDDVSFVLEYVRRDVIFVLASWVFLAWSKTIKGLANYFNDENWNTCWEKV